MLDALNAVPLAGLMLVIALGYSAGRVQLRGFSLGAAGATLFVALALGWLGITAEGGASGELGASIGSFGFALFIYSVGFEAGPRFFSIARDRGGWRFVAAGVGTNLLALGLVLWMARGLGLDASTAAGVLAGALTSAPTYAAASELAPDPTHLAVTFALAYPIGLVGVVLLVQAVPRWLHSELSRGVESEDEELHRAWQRGRPASGRGREVTRTYAVERAELTGRPLRELALPAHTGCVLSRIHREGEFLIPGGDTRLMPGDLVAATGRIDELRRFEALVGSEVHEGEVVGRLPRPRRIQVRRPEVLGRTLADLGLIARFGCVVVRIERDEVWIEPEADVALARDDVLEVVGRREDVQRLAAELGRFEPPASQTNLTLYAGGILLGLALGSARLELLGLDFSLGRAGGLLIAGLALGRLRRIGAWRTEVPRDARQLVRDLGILLFVGETGLAAGGQLHSSPPAELLTVVLAAALLTTATVLGALALGRVALRLRPVDAWGSLAGGLTSSAALHAVRQAADSNEPAVSYAAAYAVASVLATVAGQIVVALLV